MLDISLEWFMMASTTHLVGVDAVEVPVDQSRVGAR